MGFTGSAFLYECGLKLKKTIYSYKYAHTDGRVSYPLCFIFCSPVGCKPEQQMMYAGSKNRLVQIAELTKVFETRTTDDLSEEWLKEKLAFFT
ncbi:hypothetical protein COCON_G00187530 [Conger conger]|uniref:ADF-H domain-containing protein n=1 Tax=Conger conger TaxID=82655 RepID=A0A9Q1D2V8_CONCO|nr:hypothetical protein COCON_G00187530 [Conger conger]